MNTSVPTAQWDTFVTSSPTGSFLQRSAWGHFRSQRGWAAARIALHSGDEIVAGAQVLFRTLPLGRNFAYIPRGPILSDPSNVQLLSSLMEAVHDYCRQEGSLLLSVEPNWAYATARPNRPPGSGLAKEGIERLEAFGFHPGSTHIQPAATIMLDLRPPEEEIMAQMHQKWRYNIRLSGRKDVVVRQGELEDFQHFYQLTETTGQRNDFGTRPRGYYEDAWQAFQPDAKLFIAEYESRPLAAIMVVKSGNTATYLYGASSNEERNRMPNHALQWAAMQWAKCEGCAWYDFWGVPPEVPADGEVNEYGEGGLWGVFRFKQGFGGQVVKYAGTFEYPYSRLGYFLYQQYVARRGEG